MSDLVKPYGFDISLEPGWEAQFDRKLERRLSALAGYFADQEAVGRALAQDPLLYEVHEMLRPEESGELLHGLSIVHPGRIGGEFFMTKGHYHSVRATAEVYVGLRGHGLLLMENEAGEWACEEFRPGRVVYVTPGWAHRSINVHATEDLVTFFAYPGHAGHDYASIEARGFRKIVRASAKGWELADNPRWVEAGTAVA